MRQTWERIVDLWQLGNFWIRLAIVFVLAWPAVMVVAVLEFAGVRGDAAVALALVPTVALVLLLLVIPPMLPVLLVVLPVQPFDDIRFLRRIQFPSRAERLRVLRRTLKFLTLVAGIETAIGIYLAVVPVWRDRGLILWLVAVVVLFVLTRYGWIRHRWLTRAFMVAFLVITLLFFLGGRQEALQLSGRAVQAVSQAGQAVGQAVTATVPSVQALQLFPPEEFTVNSREEVDTVATGSGTQHRVSANNDWVLVSKTADGTLVEYQMPAGRRSIVGTSIEGPARVKGLKDGTTLRFERVR